VILVDTSVWIDHFNRDSKELGSLLHQVVVISHPFVIGEIACGNLKNRKGILELFTELPGAIQAEHHEVLRLIESNGLQGRGIGWINAHLLASALLSKALLWTNDRKLAALADGLGIVFRSRL